LGGGKMKDIVREFMNEGVCAVVIILIIVFGILMGLKIHKDYMIGMAEAGYEEAMAVGKSTSIWKKIK
jgi:hypothetical protein